MFDYLKPIINKGRAMYLAYDHGFEHGLRDLKEKNLDPEYILNLAVKGGYTAIILQKGIAEKYYYGTFYQKKIPLIIKVNGKSDLPEIEEPYSPLNCSVAYAKKLGAKAIGYTIYLGSKEEGKMFEDFGRIQEEAHKAGIAAIAWVYPRGTAIKDEFSPAITAYAARVGLELGADMIKIKYCQPLDGFKQAVKAAGRTKVVLSGGPQLKEDEFFDILEKIMAAGAVGIAVGRNVWQSEEPLVMTEKIKKVIWR